jgi:hypothetical protein
MTRLTTGALCLITTLAISAAVAASASALPEFTGPFPKPFTSTSKTTILETGGKTKVKCAADTNKGEITGPNAGFVIIKFTGCELKALRCTSQGAAPGEIVTFPLTTTLGYIKKEPKEVGLDLSNPAGAVVAEFLCVNATVRIVVRGSVIGRITPVNKVVSPGGHFTVKFTQKAGTQQPISFEGMPPDFLETSVKGGPFEPSGLASVDLLSFGAVPVAIKA